MGKQRDQDDATFDAFEREMNELARGSGKSFGLAKKARKHLVAQARERRMPLAEVLEEIRLPIAQRMQAFVVASEGEVEALMKLSMDPLGEYFKRMKTH